MNNKIDAPLLILIQKQEELIKTQEKLITSLTQLKEVKNSIIELQKDKILILENFISQMLASKAVDCISDINFQTEKESV